MARIINAARRLSRQQVDAGPDRSAEDTSSDLE